MAPPPREPRRARVWRRAAAWGMGPCVGGARVRARVCVISLYFFSHK